MIHLGYKCLRLQNRVYKCNIPYKNKSPADMRGFAPDSGLISKKIIDKLRRIGNFGEKLDLSQFQPDKNYKNRNY